MDLKMYIDRLSPRPIFPKIFLFQRYALAESQGHQLS